jgi:hypothetical protein
MFWLKADAPLNMSVIFVTLPVVQLPMFWLKVVAPLNIFDIFVTFVVSQPVMLLLNDVAPSNAEDRLVTDAGNDDGTEVSVTAPLKASVKSVNVNCVPKYVTSVKYALVVFLFNFVKPIASIATVKVDAL